MDDFFLPMEMRTPERLQTPGGNVHYERFQTDVLPHLRSQAEFSYPRFDCSVMQLNGERAVRGAEICLVEGAYSCHPALGAYMDVRAFSHVDTETQKARILARNGDRMLARFINDWIPMEESYFKTFDIEKKAAIVL